MIRSVAIFAVALALLIPQVHADEDRGPLRRFGVILKLGSWPPQGEAATLIREKLEDAGFEESDRLKWVQTWIFRPSGSMAPGISDLCADLMRDKRTRALLEGCWPDEPVFPQTPERPRQ
ncbi:MAG: hypothetical protein OXE86_03730 [Alphaproteobacteria bacterium]|nr:hypothetical protein [Alphaproteobacteria bacterium]